jgi:hypothetical protein
MYDGNKLYVIGEIQVKCRARDGYMPSKRQLVYLTGIQRLVWSGEPDERLFAETAFGKPVCELQFVRFAE